MDQAVGTWPARFNRHVQGPCGEARAQVRVQSPADHSSAECIEHYRQEGELLDKPNISDVRDP
jgi:hypothetical protein